MLAEVPAIVKTVESSETLLILILPVPAAAIVLLNVILISSVGVKLIALFAGLELLIFGGASDCNTILVADPLLLSTKSTSPSLSISTTFTFATELPIGNK